MKSIRKSHKPEKKWDATFVYPDGHQKVVPFGAAGMSDYTKHKDKTRRANYLKRSAGIHDSGKYSANQLARHLLW